MFEVGKLSDESMDSLLSELEKVLLMTDRTVDLLISTMYFYINRG